MASYETRVISIGNVTATLSRASKDNAGERLEAVLKWIADTIDNSLPGQGGRPDQGLPGSQPGPDNTLPGGQGGRPGQGLPGEPDQGLPGGKPGKPDQSLPGAQPGPDNTLPGGKPGTPDQGLPDSQPSPDQDLPLDQLSEFLSSKAKEIAREVLKGTACDPAAPKK